MSETRNRVSITHFYKNLESNETSAHHCWLFQVHIFVDNVRVGEATSSMATPHHIVHRLCELDMHIAGDVGQTGLQQGVGFEFKLPELPQGKHQVLSASFS